MIRPSSASLAIRHDEQTEAETSQDDKFGFVNTWAEIETPHAAIGIAAYGNYLSGETGVNVRLGGHLRLGSVFGLDAGYLDRDALLGVTTLHVGFTGMLDRDGGRVERLEDVRYRYGFGGMSYPSPRDWLGPPGGFYAFGEFLPTERFSLGLACSILRGGGMFGLSLRYRVAD